jgi:hypothetical protein
VRFEDGGLVAEGVATGGVEREGQRDERRALRVNCDRAYLATVDLLAYVEVSGVELRGWVQIGGRSTDGFVVDDVCEFVGK